MNFILFFIYDGIVNCHWVFTGSLADSTNIIDKPEVAVITNIAMDHTAYLGDSIEKIAFEI